MVPGGPGDAGRPVSGLLHDVQRFLRTRIGVQASTEPGLDRQGPSVCVTRAPPVDDEVRFRQGAMRPDVEVFLLSPVVCIVLAR